MKKLISLLLAVLFPLCAAAAQEPASPALEWCYDGASHWQLDADGQVINLGAHMPDDSWICAGCGYEILAWGDGTVDVTVHNEYGSPLYFTTFSGEERIYESRHVYDYNEDGLMLRDVEYINGTLYSETIYTVSAEGESLPLSMTAWNEDGTTSVNTYDTYGNCVRAAVYNADGTLSCEILSEYTPIEDDWFGTYFYESKTTTIFDTGETFSKETNRYGDTLRSCNTYADGTAWSDTSYEYGYRGGSKLWSKQYSFGVLTSEDFFNEEGNCEKTIEHLEDGATLVSLYNDMGDVTAETAYAADGSIRSSTAHEYVYDSEMTLLEYRMYVDSILTKETLYAYTEEMMLSGYTETVYHPDGTHSSAFYDDSFELIRTVVYAADGSILREEAAPVSPEDEEF